MPLRLQVHSSSNLIIRVQSKFFATKVINDCFILRLLESPHILLGISSITSTVPITHNIQLHLTHSIRNTISTLLRHPHNLIYITTNEPTTSIDLFNTNEIKTPTTQNNLSTQFCNFHKIYCQCTITEQLQNITKVNKLTFYPFPHLKKCLQ